MDYLKNDEVELFIDLSNKSIGLPFDRGVCGLSSFKKLLSLVNIPMSVSYLPIKKSVPYLSAQKILVIPPYCGGWLCKSDIVHLNNFLGRGGTLIVVGEHNNAYGSSEQLNRFLIKHGAMVINWAAFGEGSAPIDYFWPTCNSDVLLVDRFRLCLAAGIYSDSSWEQLAKSNTITGALSNVCSKKRGDLNLYYLGDSEIFWNLALDNSECGQDNRAFLSSLISYSVEKNQSQKNIEKKFLKIGNANQPPVFNEGVKKIIIFGDDGKDIKTSYGLLELYCYFAEKGIEVINYKTLFAKIDDEKQLDCFDYALVLPDYNELTDGTTLLEIVLKKEKIKWIVVLDGQSDIASEPSDTFFDIWALFPQLEYENKNYKTATPLLEDALGYRSLGVTLISKTKSPYKVGLKGVKFYGATTFCLNADNTKNMSFAISFKNSKTKYASRSFLPAANSFEPTFSMAQEIPQNCYLFFRNDKKLILSDYEMICNLYFNRSKGSRLFLKELEKFLD